MFIAKNNDLIVLAKETREELEEALRYIVYTTIEETEDELILYGGQYKTLEEVNTAKREELARLYVTRLDFIKILEELGLPWSNMKAIMAQYPEVEKELTMCSNVYRGNTLIDNMIPLINQAFGLNITTVDLDNAFIEKCGRTDLQRTE